MVGIKKETPRWQRLVGTRRLNGRCIVTMVGDGINDAPVRDFALCSALNKNR